MNLNNPLLSDSLGLMLFMLNPFLLIIYLIDLVETLDPKTFTRILIRSSLISAVVYLSFAFIGDSIFQYLFQSDFASFQIFGGIIFLITGIRFVFDGTKAIVRLRGEPGHIEGGIVMPIMIGPGTISASILVGKRLPFLQSALVILAALVLCIVVVIFLKYIYENAQKKNEKLVLKYIDIVGRVAALLIGTFSIEMIMNGLIHWMSKFPG